MKYTNLKKYIWLIVVTLLVTMLVILLVYYFIKVSSYHESENYLRSSQNGYIEEAMDENTEVDLSEDRVLYRTTDILNHYKERIGDDYAFLILNEAVIAEYKVYRSNKLKRSESSENIEDNIEKNEEQEYFVYYLGNQDNNIVQKYKGDKGETYDGVFYNFNRLLLDNSILKDMSGNFISERGFSTSLMKDMNLSLDNFITVDEEEMYTKSLLYNVKQEEIGVVYTVSTLIEGGN